MLRRDTIPQCYRCVTTFVYYAYAESEHEARSFAGEAVHDDGSYSANTIAQPSDGYMVHGDGWDFDTLVYHEYSDDKTIAQALGCEGLAKVEARRAEVMARFSRLVVPPKVAAL
jgi:hypothetical protein